MVRSRHTTGYVSHDLSGSSRRRCDRGRLSPIPRRPLRESRSNRSYRNNDDRERSPRHIEERDWRSRALRSSRHSIDKERKESKSKRGNRSKSRSIPSSNRRSLPRASSYSSRTNSDRKDDKRQRVKEVERESKTKPERTLVSAESKITESSKRKVISGWLPLPCMPFIYTFCHSLSPNWCGTLAVGKSIKCQIVMEPLPGHYYQFNHLKKHNLQILGGIKRGAVWECMENIKTRGKKKVAIVLIRPLSPQESESYNKIFNYFHVRRQIGHIGYRTKNMSFFLLLPLPAQRRLKSILKSFHSESSGQAIWPRINKNIMLGIMLLQPQDDVQLHKFNSLMPFLPAQTLHGPPFMIYGGVGTQALKALSPKQ